jgi:16S rRNA (uracil1498-N3)-methyltransferase
MVGYDRRSAVAHFWVPSRVAVGDAVALERDAVHHVRVLRLAPGNHVGLTDGRGQRAAGTLTTLRRSSAVVRVDEVKIVPPPYPIHVLVPIADRERMLWLAEKCVELQAASWRPIHWHRSTSVATRGTGTAFTARVVARMRAALAQSHGAWLPELHEPATVDRAIHDAPPGTRVVLDPDGRPLLAVADDCGAQAVTIAVGPEGGLGDAELDQLVAAGFVRASLGDTILRFETAAVAALAVVRAATAAARP